MSHDSRKMQWKLWERRNICRRKKIDLYWYHIKILEKIKFLLINYEYNRCEYIYSKSSNIDSCKVGSKINLKTNSKYREQYNNKHSKNTNSKEVVDLSWHFMFIINMCLLLLLFELVGRFFFLGFELYQVITISIFLKILSKKYIWRYFIFYLSFLAKFATNHIFPYMWCAYTLKISGFCSFDDF